MLNRCITQAKWYGTLRSEKNKFVDTFHFSHFLVSNATSQLHTQCSYQYTENAINRIKEKNINNEENSLPEVLADILPGKPR